MFLTEEQIELNKQKYMQMLRETNVEGVENLIAWLNQTDFFYAPASTLYHCNYRGGLCEHSLNVAETAQALDAVMRPLMQKHKPNNFKMYDPEEVVIAALLHDLCKVGIYVPATKWVKDSNNNWISYQGFEIEDNQLPLGHGEKSLFFAQQFIKLKINTALAIRWHMHSFAQGVAADEFTKYPMIAALENYPLVSIIMQADSMTAFMLEEKFDPKVLKR